MPDAVSWVGGTVGNLNDWATKDNWNPKNVPTSIDDVTIPAVANAPTISAAGAKAQSVTITNGGILFVDTNATLDVQGLIDVTGANSEMVMRKATVTAGFVHVSATLLMVNGSKITATPVAIQAGGELETDSSNNLIVGGLGNDGTVNIGGVNQAPGSLNVTGDFNQYFDGTLKLYGSGNFTPSVLAVSGTATLGGVLATASDGTANPTRDKTITVLIAGSVNQTFATTDVAWGNRNKWNLTYGSTDVVLKNTGAGVNNNGMIFPGTDGSDVYLGHFSDLGVYSSSASDYTITVDWGNGVTTTARIDYFDQGSESEVYAPSGCDSSQSGTEFLVTVTITDNVGGGSWQQQIYAYVF